MIKNILLFGVILFAGLNNLAAQTPTKAKTSAQQTRITARAKFNADSVQIIWSPSQSSDWMANLDDGYFIERLELDKNGAVLERKKLTPQPVKHWTEAEFEKRFDVNDNFQLLAAQALFGRNYGTEGAATGGATGLFGMAEEQRRRLFFATLACVGSKVAGNALGQRFVDRQILRGRLYEYRVWSAASPEDVATVRVATDKNAELPPINFSTQAGDSVVQIEFLAATYTDVFPFYFVQRFNETTKKWENRTKEPILMAKGVQKDSSDALKIVFNDSLPSNGQAYRYQLMGMDNFADRATASAPQTVIGRDSKPPTAVIFDKTEVTNENFIKMTWEKKVVEPDFVGYKIVRSDNPDTAFTTISGDNLLSAATTNFVDKEPSSDGLSFYKIVAVDKSGNETESFPFPAEINDTIPPSVPTDLKGTMDTLGRVKISWLRSPQKDVLGYKVYRSSLPDNGFFVISKEPVLTTYFEEMLSVNSIDAAVYYRVVAIDRKYNHSVQSDSLRILKPVKIPPTAPVLRDYEVQNGKIYLNWANSSSENLTKHCVLRSDDGKNWQPLAVISAPVDSRKRTSFGTFTDSTVAVGKTYYYTVEAVNSGNLTAQAQPLIIEVFDDRPKAKIDGLKAAIQEDAVVLSWQYPTTEGYFIRVYRSDNGGNFEQIRDIKPMPMTWQDRANKPSGKLTYMLKAVFDDGKESPLSAPVSVNLNQN